jgi:tetratricopeptide (TPR) repeat protein
LRGGYSEALTWIKDAGIDDEQLWESDEISQEVKGRTLAWAALGKLMLLHIDEGMRLAREATKILRKTDDAVTLATALCTEGCYGTFINAPGAAERLEEGKALAEKVQHPFPLCMVYLWSFDYYLQQGKLGVVEENFERARQIGIEHDYVYMLVTLFTIRYLMVGTDESNDYEETASEALRMFDMMPEKGYKGMKSAVMGAYTYSLLKLNRIEEAEKSIRKALQLARESGEKETDLHRTVEAALLFAMKGNDEKACKLLGAGEAFSQSSGYPLVGTAEVQCQEIRDISFNQPQAEKWYEEGRKMSIDKAVLLAMAE